MAVKPTPPRVRRAGERRRLVLVNLVLLGAALVVAVPGTVRSLSAAAREAAECAKLRELLAAPELRDFEAPYGAGSDDDVGTAGLDQPMTRLAAERFERIGIRGLLDSHAAIALSRRNLATRRTKAAAAEKAVEGLVEALTERQVALLGVAKALTDVCLHERAEQGDCEAIGALLDLRFAPRGTVTSVLEELRGLAERFDATEKLAVANPRLRAIVADIAKASPASRAATRKALEAVSALDADRTDTGSETAAMTRATAHLRRQLAALRFYCEAPVVPLEETTR